MFQICQVCSSSTRILAYLTHLLTHYLQPLPIYLESLKKKLVMQDYVKNQLFKLISHKKSKDEPELRWETHHVFQEDPLDDGDEEI